MPFRMKSLSAVTFLAFLVALPAAGQITPPEKVLGFPIGADYELASYRQMLNYWEILARESDRIALDTIGLTQEGRPQVMAIVTSPENHRNLAHYKEIARRLALAKGVPEAEARRLAQEGKAIVWIDGGLHSTEVVGAQQLLELVYQMVARHDPETLRILENVILLAVPANPDGMELVAEWYYRTDAEGGTKEQRNFAGLPVLYQKYAGHDNNRDFYMGNLAETGNMLRVKYREWFPQIVYNHHQTGPQGTILFAPPFRDPPNHFLDPLIITSLEQVGSAMHHRFVQEGKGGSTMRSGAGYSTWWNGGLRTTPYFHNAIGLLTEIRGGPNPEPIAFVPGRQISSNDLPLPVEPGVLRMATAIEYSQTANRAVLDYASRNKDVLLFNIWRMGRNSIERGSRDSWTIRPSDIERAAEALGGRNASGSAEDFRRLLRDPARRDPRGFILPSDQKDFPRAVRFVNALVKNGVEVMQAVAPFAVAGRNYPAGSLVIKADQAYRPHVLDMFEPQDHPHDFAYPGGPPVPPYDVTGWTLAYQMGVEFHRVLEGFDGPFRAVPDTLVPPPGQVRGPPNPQGFLLSHEVNNAFKAVYRLLAGGRSVYWITSPVTAGGETFPEGTFFIPGGREVRGVLEGFARELGVDFIGVVQPPQGPAMVLERPRIGLWDRYGGSMPSGWIRFILDEFGYDYQVVYPAELDAGGLREKFDVLIFPDGAIPAGLGRGGPGGGGGGAGGLRGMGGGQTTPSQVPAAYRGRLGNISLETTLPRIREFLEQGGVVLALESSTALGRHLGLPVQDHLRDAQGNPYRSEEFYIPGSLLEVRVLKESPVSHGLGDRVVVTYDQSPVFRLPDRSPILRPVAVFDSPNPLRSGWAWGQEKLQGGVAMLEARVGEGTLFLFGPQITFRGQPHGTFPFFFNGILLAGARDRP